MHEVPCVGEDLVHGIPVLGVSFVSLVTWSILVV